MFDSCFVVSGPWGWPGLIWSISTVLLNKEILNVALSRFYRLWNIVQLFKILFDLTHFKWYWNGTLRLAGSE